MANDIVVPLSKRKNLKMEEKSAPQTSGEMVKKLAEKIKKKSFKISFSNHWSNIVGNPQQNSCYNVIQDWIKYYFANVDKYVKQILNFLNSKRKKKFSTVYLMLLNIYSKNFQMKLRNKKSLTNSLMKEVFSLELN
jgi:hypothetical protein